MSSYKTAGDVTVASSSGIGFVGLLQIAFIVLKLCDVITWGGPWKGWFWVLSPIIFTAGLVLLVFMIGLIYFIISCRK